MLWFAIIVIVAQFIVGTVLLSDCKKNVSQKSAQTQPGWGGVTRTIPLPIPLPQDQAGAWIGRNAAGLPTHDDEVYAMWQKYDDALLRNILSGLYRTYRLQGKSVVEAYIQTLQAHSVAGKPEGGEAK